MSKFKEIPFTDDFMFSLVMRDEAICMELLKKILPEEDFTEIRIEAPSIDIEGPEITTQEVMRFAEASKGVRFDAYIKSKGIWAEIEMQNYKGEDIAKRSRYYLSNMDIDALDKGADYKKLPTSYVIFICTYDYIGMDKPIHSFYTYDIENGVKLDDRVCRIILNTKCTPEKVPDSLKEFYRYLNNPSESYEDEFIARLDSSVKKYNTEDWRRKHMTLGELMERNKEIGYEEGLSEGRELGISEGHKLGLSEGREMGISEGRELGARENSEITAFKMKENGVSIDIIVKCTGLSVEEVEELE